MSHRTILTDRQRTVLFALPDEREELVARYVLSDADIEIIRRHRGDANQLGFALQLCAFRWPGRLLQQGEVIPSEMLGFIAAQLGIADPDAALGYGRRATTRYQHSAALQKIYGFRPLGGPLRQEMRAWLAEQAAATSANSALAAAFLDELRRRRIIVPAATTVERMCAEALVQAEQTCIDQINSRLRPHHRARLDTLLEDAPGEPRRFHRRLRSEYGWSLWNTTPERTAIHLRPASARFGWLWKTRRVTATALRRSAG